MRAVIYDDEGLEPLTVIEVPQHFVREIESGKRPPYLSFPVPSDLCAHVLHDGPAVGEIRRVSVRFEPIYKGRERMMWLCTAADAESVLLLRSEFLPGQRSEVERLKTEAFLKGLLAAMA